MWKDPSGNITSIESVKSSIQIKGNCPWLEIGAPGPAGKNSSAEEEPQPEKARAETEEEKKKSKALPQPGAVSATQNNHICPP